MATLKADANTSIWASAPGTGQGANLGKDSTELVGFYGTIPIAKQTIPTAATGTEIAAALAALGLVNLS